MNFSTLEQFLKESGITAVITKCVGDGWVCGMAWSDRKTGEFRSVEAGPDKESGTIRVPASYSEAISLCVQQVVTLQKTGQELLEYYKRIANDYQTFSPEKKYVVRVFDGMDGCWDDCGPSSTAEEAVALWMLRTQGGTKQVSFSDIDYFKIFPASTKMLYSGSNELFREIPETDDSVPDGPETGDLGEQEDDDVGA